MFWGTVLWLQRKVSHCCVLTGLEDSAVTAAYVTSLLCTDRLGGQCYDRSVNYVTAVYWQVWWTVLWQQRKLRHCCVVTGLVDNAMTEVLFTSLLCTDMFFGDSAMTEAVSQVTAMYWQVWRTVLWQQRKLRYYCILTDWVDSATAAAYVTSLLCTDRFGGQCYDSSVNYVTTIYWQIGWTVLWQQRMSRHCCVLTGLVDSAMTAA